jgi:uncharacterized membrane protein YbhN (UPF0104 family)|tara:strand:- start:2941 stop:3114 length:174 start_codon:yes stop_codon:yes gene_type:complete
MMKRLGKKAFLFKIIGFIVFVIAIVVLVFLIKNDWDVGMAINEFIEFIKKLKEQTSS